MAFYFIVCNTGIWIWLEEMLISSNMHGAILLLNNYYCSAAMIEVCLCSKKSAIRWVLGPQTTFYFSYKVSTVTCNATLTLL